MRVESFERLGPGWPLAGWVWEDCWDITLLTERVPGTYNYRGFTFHGYTFSRDFVISLVFRYFLYSKVSRNSKTTIITSQRILLQADTNTDFQYLFVFPLRLCF